jgi:hypothetical protein
MAVSSIFVAVGEQANCTISRRDRLLSRDRATATVALGGGTP